MTKPAAEPVPVKTTAVHEFLLTEPNLPVLVKVGPSTEVIVEPDGRAPHVFTLDQVRQLVTTLTELGVLP